MRANPDQPLPLARKDELIVQELPDELLVYDLVRHKAHCLNKTSAFVWKHCDGKTTVAQTARLLEREFSQLVDDDVVWLALSQLRRFHLLDEAGGGIFTLKVTRRDLVRKYLPLALSLPLIMSIAAPTPAQSASTCADVGEPCGDGVECCQGLTCDGSCFESSGF
jgi:Coenzyme PQQ synthesis protein D (PqqD)